MPLPVRSSRSSSTNRPPHASGHPPAALAPGRAQPGLPGPRAPPMSQPSVPSREQRHRSQVAPPSQATLLRAWPGTGRSPALCLLPGDVTLPPPPVAYLPRWTSPRPNTADRAPPLWVLAGPRSTTVPWPTSGTVPAEAGTSTAGHAGNSGYCATAAWRGSWSGGAGGALQAATARATAALPKRSPLAFAMIVVLLALAQFLAGPYAPPGGRCLPEGEVLLGPDRGDVNALPRWSILRRRGERWTSTMSN